MFICRFFYDNETRRRTVTLNSVYKPYLAAGICCRNTWSCSSLSEAVYFNCHVFIGSGGSVVHIMIGLWIRRPIHRGSIPCRSNKFCFLKKKKSPVRLRGPRILIVSRYGCSCSGQKRTGLETDHSPPSSTESNIK